MDRQARGARGGRRLVGGRLRAVEAVDELQDRGREGPRGEAAQAKARFEGRAHPVIGSPGDHRVDRGTARSTRRGGVDGDDRPERVADQRDRDAGMLRLDLGDQRADVRRLAAGEGATVDVPLDAFACNLTLSDGSRRPVSGNYTLILSRGQGVGAEIEVPLSLTGWW